MTRLYNSHILPLKYTTFANIATILKTKKTRTLNIHEKYNPVLRIGNAMKPRK